MAFPQRVSSYVMWNHFSLKKKSIVTFATRIWFLYSVYRDVFQDYCLMKKHSHTGYIYMDSHHCVTSYVMWNHCCLMTKALSHWLQEYGVSPVCVHLFLMITVWWKKQSHIGYMYMDSCHCVSSYAMWNHCCLMKKSL